MSNDWEPAREALLRDLPRRGSRIVELVIDGLVRTRAAVFFDGREPATRDVELDQRFWAAMRTKTGSAYRDWGGGIFKTELPDQVSSLLPRTAKRAVGVVFCRSDLDAYLPHHPGFEPNKAAVATPLSAAAPAPEKRTGGAPPKIDVWHQFYLHALQMLNNGEIEAMPTAAALRKTLISAVDFQISDDSAKPVVARIWHLLKDGVPVGDKG